MAKGPALVTSCIYEVAEGLEVTDRYRARAQCAQTGHRAAACPQPLSSPAARHCRRRSAWRARALRRMYKGCILCGQCVRTCREVVGVAAIGFKGRGSTRMVVTPFDKAPPDCIACGSCSYICPVNVIPLEDKPAVRTIWKTEFPMAVVQKVRPPLCSGKAAGLLP